MVELKGQQISSSTVFMLSGMETTSKSKAFMWCHCDFSPLLLFINTKGEEGALQTWEMLRGLPSAALVLLAVNL